VPNFLHRSVTGTDTHEAFHYAQLTDPGAVGAGLYWLNTAVTPYALNRRDPTNTSWVAVASAGATGEIVGTDFNASGLPNALNQTRLVGATTGGSPSAGTWQQGDFVTDYNGKIWVCSAAGTPGTWHQVSDGGTLDVAFGGAGIAIAAGIKGDFRLDTDVNIIGWRMYADVVGQITVDIWKTTHGSFPPTIANTIVSGGGTLPNINGSDHSQFANLTGWTTLVAKGSILRFNVSGVATITRATLALEVLRV